MKLAKNEKIIRTWDYADTKRGSSATHSKLTVTNHRIISENEGTYTTSRKEIPVSAVQSVTSSTRRNSNALGIFLIVLGALFAIVPFMLSMDKGVAMVAYLVGILVGAVMILVGVSLLNRGAFYLIITTTGVENTAMVLGRSNLFTSKSNNDCVKIKIAKDVVKDMLDTLGAIIVDVKCGTALDDEEITE